MVEFWLSITFPVHSFGRKDLCKICSHLLPRVVSPRDGVVELWKANFSGPIVRRKDLCKICWHLVAFVLIFPLLLRERNHRRRPRRLFWPRPKLNRPSGSSIQVCLVLFNLAWIAQSCNGCMKLKISSFFHHDLNVRRSKRYGSVWRLCFVIEPRFRLVFQHPFC